MSSSVIVTIITIICEHVSTLNVPSAQLVCHVCDKDARGIQSFRGENVIETDRCHLVSFDVDIYCRLEFLNDLRIWSVFLEADLAGGTHIASSPYTTPTT